MHHGTAFGIRRGIHTAPLRAPFVAGCHASRKEPVFALGDQPQAGRGDGSGRWRHGSGPNRDHVVLVPGFASLQASTNDAHVSSAARRSVM